ncbi:hypothetical protein BLNAU_24369 [Blattamonas nauphoetae]|uniref:Uncharacterized protein n=1 Tax=Blattamonas nauphoetae TaxID=2049346 RepID=A0ABQ9WQF3_9EUKA|nr:hypothetical protein BLNAU_24369 [Blattamonas nauphoetae]
MEQNPLFEDEGTTMIGETKERQKKEQSENRSDDDSHTHVSIVVQLKWQRETSGHPDSLPTCFQTLRSFVSLRVQERTAVTLLTLLLISNDIMPSFVLSSNLDSLLISLLNTFVREHATSQTETPNSVANHTLPAKVESGHSACEDSLRDDELTVHLLLALLSHYVNILSKQLTCTFTDLSGESSEHLVPDDWLPSLGPNEVDDGWDDAVGGEYGAETDHFDGNSDVPEVKRMVSWKRTILMVELSKLFPESTMIQSDIFTILQQASLASRMSGAPVKLSSSVSRALCLNATRTLRNDDLSTHLHSLSILGWLQENIHTCVSMISESPSAFFPLTALLTPSVHSASPRHCDMALYLISELLTNYQRHCRPDHLHLPADAGESDDYVSIALSPTDFVPHTPSPSAPLPHPLNSPQHLWSNFEGEYHRMMLALLERERMGIVMMVAQKLRGEGGRPEVFVSALIQSLADETKKEKE